MSNFGIAPVRKDVGSGDPHALHGGAKVALTLDEWKAFWTTHKQQNDLHSVTRKGITVSYDQDTLELILNVPFELADIGSTNHEKIDNDFGGKQVVQDGTALPGPFQSPRKGENVFKVWDGLPLLEEGELP